MHIAKLPGGALGMSTLNGSVRYIRGGNTDKPSKRKDTDKMSDTIKTGRQMRRRLLRIHAAIREARKPGRVPADCVCMNCGAITYRPGLCFPCSEIEAGNLDAAEFTPIMPAHCKARLMAKVRAVFGTETGFNPQIGGAL